MSFQWVSCELKFFTGVYLAWPWVKITINLSSIHFVTFYSTSWYMYLPTSLYLPTSIYLPTFLYLPTSLHLPTSLYFSISLYFCPPSLYFLIFPYSTSYFLFLFLLTFTLWWWCNWLDHWLHHSWRHQDGCRSICANQVSALRGAPDVSELETGSRLWRSKVVTWPLAESGN